ncbi:hypothetical protein NQ317_009204 [Molorchus minor]|uniref:Uncharacterized protein n=1 Tax=Molorchus minor TaxID=1323400 RepID=A0ABQ9JD43_9CUCU|nr:hypothetical protein NQ317_009204 [Molorchus minor]
MSTLERKEYQETKILRSVSPVRNTRTSTQNISQLDSNLDYLLEDLQNSVSRPGSSLGQSANTYRETSRSVNTLDSGYRSNSLNRIANVKPSNPTTEYSSDDAFNYTSPDGRERVHGYKKEKYMYKTSGGGDILPEANRMQNSINQLDSLLDDLQQVKKSSITEKGTYLDIFSIKESPITQLALIQLLSKTKTVNRELHYGDTPRSTARSRTLERTEREGSLRREYTSEGTYGDLRQIRTSSPSPSSRTSTLSKQTLVKNIHGYPVEVTETITPEIDPEVLAHLDPNLRPPGNTKVTTTIKTYTYEIPGSGEYPTNLTSNSTETDKYVYSPNQTITTPSKSFVYSKTENKENTLYQQEPSWQTNINKQYNETVTENYPPYQKPAPPGGVVVKETITTRNYQPGYSPVTNPPSSHQTYVYNEGVTQGGTPPSRETYLVKETHNTTVNKNEPPFSERGYPVYNPPDDKNPPHTTCIIKETHNTTNKTSTNTTHNTYKGGYPPGDDTQTLLPQKFPTDDGPDGPPKKLDELMATIGNEPPSSPLNAGFTAHEQDLAQMKKVETLKRQAAEADAQKKEPVIRTKNVSGPPVYYPPGHEMFAKKEESEAAYRAQGGYAKASGKYQYEAESKSKSKSSSGATVVPVCLPLCCGLPCVLL